MASNSESVCRRSFSISATPSEYVTSRTSSITTTPSAKGCLKSLVNPVDYEQTILEDWESTKDSIYKVEQISKENLAGSPFVEEPSNTKEILVSAALVDEEVNDPMLKVDPITVRTPSADVKPLFDDMPSESVPYRIFFNKRSPDVWSKSRTRDEITVVPQLSHYISQMEVDEVVNAEKVLPCDVSCREIASSKRIDFGWFAANDFDVAPMFVKLGLKEFCETYAEVGIGRIRDFYANLTFYKVGSSVKYIKTMIDGIVLVYSTHDVNAVFGCMDHVPLLKQDKNHSYSAILGEKTIPAQYLESSSLDLQKRVIHRAVVSCLLPRIGNVDTIIPKDAQVMECLLTGTPFNLGALIFGHMEACLKNANKALPYGQVIARLLRIHGIDATPSSEQDKWRVGTFGSQIISSMNYLKTQSGWILKTQSSELTQNALASAMIKGKVVLKGPVVLNSTASGQFRGNSTSSSQSSLNKELQRQVASNTQDIKVLQKLFMDLSYTVEHLRRQNLEARPSTEQ